MTRIISAFPGTGKTHFYRESVQYVLDSDSSVFSWESKGVRHPEFPKNYIRHINKWRQASVDMILVSSHREVRDALAYNDIRFELVYPHKDLLGEYLNRFIQRGSPDAFIDMMREKWDEFFLDMQNQRHCDHILLREGQYLSDVLKG